MKGLILFLALLINAVLVLSGTVYKVKVDTSLNIRSGPGTNYKVVGSLKNGNLIYATDVSGNWAKFYKGYVSVKYLTKATDPSKYETTANLNFRRGPGTNNSIINTLKKGTTVNYYGRDPFVNKWAVTGNGYANTSYLKSKGSSGGSTGGSTGGNTGGSSLGTRIVNYAKQFIGNPYKWGGTSLTNGIDCSGFTRAIFNHFNIKINGNSKSQATQGRSVSGLSNARVADLLFYCDSRGVVEHVAIYEGNNRIVHAANKRDGIKESNANYKTPCRIRRFI